MGVCGTDDGPTVGGALENDGMRTVTRIKRKNEVVGVIDAMDTLAEADRRVFGKRKIGVAAVIFIELGEIFDFKRFSMRSREESGDKKRYGCQSTVR